jgi:hypothetical protein
MARVGTSVASPGTTANQPSGHRGELSLEDLSPEDKAAIAEARLKVGREAGRKALQ